MILQDQYYVSASKKRVLLIKMDIARNIITKWRGKEKNERIRENFGRDR